MIGLLIELQFNLQMSCSSYRQVTSAIGTTELKQVKKMALKYGVIGIDEGQFVSVHVLLQYSVCGILSIHYAYYSFRI